jgi:hypothetical protein
VSVADGGRGGYDYDSTITVEWTIDGSQSSGACADYRVDYAHVSIDNPDGFFYEDDIPCEDFGVDIDLPADTYWVTVQLFDSRDVPATRTARTDGRPVRPGRVDNVVLEFPDDSFL